MFHHSGRLFPVWTSTCRVHWAVTSSTSPQQPSSAVASCAVPTAAVCADIRTRTRICILTHRRTYDRRPGEQTAREGRRERGRASGGWAETSSASVLAGIRARGVDLEDPLQQRGDGHALNAWIYLLTPLLLHLLTWAHAIDTWSTCFLLMKCLAGQCAPNAVVKKVLYFHEVMWVSLKLKLISINTGNSEFLGV